MPRPIALSLAMLALFAACDDDTAPGADSGPDLAALDRGQTPEQGADLPLADSRSIELGTPDRSSHDAPGSCDAMDARGVGSCEMVLGTTWDGTQCVMISGCSCQGADCGKLFGGLAECNKAYAHCIP